MARRAFTVAVCLALLIAAAPTHADATSRRTRICAPVSFAGIADFRLIRIRATGVGCVTARRVVRGARLHERWKSRGFDCRVTKYDPEVATYFRCTGGLQRAITFKAG
jgi:hypothetical protein